MLSFGGGQRAMFRDAEAITQVTAAQRQQLWNIICTHQLLDKDSQPFKKSKQFEYVLKVRAGPHGQRFRVVDDDASGIEQLHETLFQIHKAAAYKLPFE